MTLARPTRSWFWKRSRRRSANSTRGRDHESEEADFHTPQRPVNQRVVETGEPKRQGRDQRRVGREPLGDSPHDHQVGGQDQHPGKHYEERRLRFGDRQQVEARHPQSPEEVGIAFDRSLPRVPDEAVAFGQIARVAHRDHRIVEQREVLLAVRAKGGPCDKNERAGQTDDDWRRERPSAPFPPTLVRRNAYPDYSQRVRYRASHNL